MFPFLYQIKIWRNFPFVTCQFQEFFFKNWVCFVVITETRKVGSKYWIKNIFNFINLKPIMHFNFQRFQTFSSFNFLSLNVKKIVEIWADIFQNGSDLVFELLWSVLFLFILSISCYWESDSSIWIELMINKLHGGRVL